MATIVLAAAVSLIGLEGAAAFAASLAAAAIGAVIDSQLILPAVLGKPGVDARVPQPPELRAPSFDEGDPFYYCLGKRVRVGCQVTAIGGLLEVPAQYSKGAVIRHDYFITCAISLARMIDGAAEALKQVWANGEVIFDVDSTFQIVSTDIETSFGEVDGLGWRRFLEAPLSTQAGQDFRRIRAGADIVISGFTNPENNGPAFVHASYIHPVFDNAVLYLGSYPDFLPEAAGNTITIDIDQEAAHPDKVEAVTFYDGGGVQDPDPNLEVIYGAGNVSAYRGKAYAVLLNLKVTKYGGSLPRMEATFVEDSSRDLDATLSLLCTLNGFVNSSLINVDNVDAQKVDGIVWRSDQPPRDIIGALLVAYDIMTFEFDGQLHFASRANLSRYIVPRSVLAVAERFGSEGGEEAPRPAQLEYPDEVALPRSVTVAFQDPARLYQQGSRTFRRRTGFSESSMRIHLPMAFSASKAEEIARKMLFLRIMNRLSTTFTLPPSLLDIHENDIARLTVPDDAAEEIDFRLERVDLGDNFLVETKGVEDFESTYNQDGEGEDSGGDDDDGSTPIPYAVVLDIPRWDAEQTIWNHVIYYAIGAVQSSQSIPGALFVRDVGESTYTRVTDFSTLSTLGLATTALPDAEPYYPDEGSVLTVKIDSGTPVSVSESQWRAGANRYVVGKEIIDVRDVTAIGGGVYQFSGLRRGRLNTEEHTGTHVIGENVVFLGGVLLREFRAQGDYPDIEYIPVPNGYDTSDFTPESVQLNGESVLAYSVWKLRATVNQTTGDITINWLWRPPFYRMLSGLKDTSGLRWNIAIYRRTIFGDELLRNTTEILDEVYPFTTVYPAGVQDSDGVVAGNTLVFKVTQLSDDGRSGRDTIEEALAVAI